jgi:hypothetical protein
MRNPRVGAAPPTSPERAALAATINEEEARRRRLEAEHIEAKARVAALRAKLATVDQARVAHPESRSSFAAVPRSPADKVKLFRRLFRGRDDLYPTRFVSKKTGKPGYAPACANKFVVGVCELPKVKCGDCTNQAFRRVDDSAVLRHLRGEHVMGVYWRVPRESARHPARCTFAFQS